MRPIAVVDDTVARCAGATPVVLGGFSQGGALALALALPRTGRRRPPATR